MSELEKADEPKVYEFSWELVGYDCHPDNISSPKFLVSFEVTEWHIDLDLSQLQNTDSCIPFCLQRTKGIGPSAVTFDVKVTVLLGANKYFLLEKSQIGRIFSEKGTNNWAFDIYMPCQKLESKDDDLNWLSPKSMIIIVEMKSSKKVDPVFPKKYWNSMNSLKTVQDDLKALYSDEGYHDLLLDVDGKKLKLHKCILNCRWPKFISTLDVGETGVDTKEFSGIPHAILKHLLEFAYCSKYAFMYNLDEIDGSDEIFSLVRKYNFYRLNDRIAQLSPKCVCSHVLQSYRTSVNMQFTNVTSTKKAMGDFRTCEIPLKPRQPKRSGRPMTAREKEKFQQHIRFMDIGIYVDKGPCGYNWLMFSVVLGKVPDENEVTIQCKLYVVGENEVKYLLTEDILVFSNEDAVPVETPFSKGKKSMRYLKTAEPVITWDELTKRENFVRKRLVMDPSSKPIEEKDIFFRFEFKLHDGEFLLDTRHDQFEFRYDPDFKIFTDLELMNSDEKYTDIEVTAGDRKIRAHKAILAARSSVLKDDLKGKASLTTLQIKTIKPECLHVFIHYLYTGQIHEIPLDYFNNLIEVAQVYDLKCLREILTAKKRDLQPAIIS